MTRIRPVPWTHHLTWGLALGAAVALATQVLTWAGLGLSYLTWISTWILVALFAYLAARSLRDRQGARPSILQALVLLVVMVLVSRVIYQTYMYVYINFVDPTWVDTVAEVWSGQLADAGVEPESIERSIASFRRQWETANVFTLGILSYALPQLVLGLIAAVVGVVQPWRRGGAAAGRDD